MKIDEKGLVAAIARYPIALQEACDAGKIASHRMKFAVRAAITAYEAAKTAEGAVALTADDQRLLDKALTASTEQQYEIAPPPPQVPDA